MSETADHGKASWESLRKGAAATASELAHTEWAVRTYGAVVIPGVLLGLALRERQVLELTDSDVAR